MLLASTSPSIPAHRSRHAPINQRLREGALPEPITSSTALGAPCLGVRLRMRGRTSQNVSMRCSPPASCTSGSIFRAAAPNLTRFWRRCAVISSAKMASVATGHTISLPFHIKTPPHTVLLRGYKAKRRAAAHLSQRRKDVLVGRHPRYASSKVFCDSEASGRSRRICRRPSRARSLALASPFVAQAQRREDQASTLGLAAHNISFFSLN